MQGAAAGVLCRLYETVTQINALEASMRVLSDDQLQVIAWLLVTFTHETSSVERNCVHAAQIVVSLAVSIQVLAETMPRKQHRMQVLQCLGPGTNR